MLKTVATVLSIPLNNKKENSQVNKLGVISKERSHVRKSEAVNLIPIHRAINHKQESFLLVTFLCYLVGLLLTNNWKWSVPPKAISFLTVVSGISRGFQGFMLQTNCFLHKFTSVRTRWKKYLYSTRTTSCEACCYYLQLND